ncbi:hypothetical protein U472_13655 [Orenia metallireducens]|uniref:Glucitol operon activator protein (GutM) n=1 Tax=Orenia metallireducens TaxID=1413210 RepID=A0A1C0A5H9_9FIRM|nr:hypothetical protein U472_13655 [Orenia metallireducens]
MIYQLIILGAIAWIVQTALGYLQIKDFNTHYSELRKLGKVIVGKNKGKISSGTVVAFAIDDSGRIIKGEYMEGISVLARMKLLEGLEDLALNKINDDDLNEYSKGIKKAVKNAIKNYKLK